MGAFIPSSWTGGRPINLPLSWNSDGTSLDYRPGDAYRCRCGYANVTVWEDPPERALPATPKTKCSNLDWLDKRVSEMRVRL